VRPEVPADVAAVLQKMMAKKQEDRYATPGELSEALLPFTQKAIGPPPEEEMPQLSAAAQGTSSAPATIAVTPRTSVTAPKTPAPGHERGHSTAIQPAPPPTRTSGAAPRPVGVNGPVALADADTHRNRPVPVVEPIPDSSPGTPIWEAISAETANASRADTDKKRRDASSRKAKVSPPQPPPAEKRREVPKPPKSQAKARTKPIVLILAAAGGVLFIGLAAFAMYWFGIREKPKTTPNTNTEPRTLVLTKNPAGAALHYPSLQKALEEFRPGDSIVIRDDVWEEFAAATRTKDLILSGADGKRVTWRAPSNMKGQQDRALLALHGAEGGRISGIKFDCGGTVSTGIRLSGPCPGLQIEDIDVLNASNTAIAIHDCIGDKGRPVVIRKSWIANPAGKDSKNAVTFTSEPPPKAASVTLGSQNIQIQHCLIEGPFAGNAFQFDGSASGVEIRQCRVWRTEHGVIFRKLIPASTPMLKVDVVGNTFHSLTGPAIRCEDAGQIKQRPDNRIGLAQNFFANVPNVARVDGDIANARFLAVEANSNFRKTGTAASPHVPTLEINSDVWTDPANRIHFLFYDRSNPLFTAFNGKPVGVPMPME
jgi:hypothetical protein